MLQCQFRPEIENGMRNMQHGELFGFLVRLLSAMIAGVALAGHDQHPSHPVRLCSKELVLLMQRLADSPRECSTDVLNRLTETVGARIWCLMYFQSDDELAKKLETLVAPVFEPAPRFISR